MWIAKRYAVTRLRGCEDAGREPPRIPVTAHPRNRATHNLRSPDSERRDLLMQIGPLDVEQHGGLDVIPVRPAQHALDVLPLAVLLELAQREDLRRGLRTDQRLRRHRW